MFSNILNKINLLSSNKKLLFIGKLNPQLESTFDKSFENKEYLDITEDSLDILNTSLYEQFDVVIIALNESNFTTFQGANINIPEGVIFIIEDNIYDKFKPFINSTYFTLISPFEEHMILDKIYGILAINEVNSILKTKEKIVSKYKNDEINDEIDVFLDQYSGSIMFINDDLNTLLERLKDLEISKEVFSEVSANLVKLSNIFAQNERLIQLSELFLEFSQFLDALDFESIEPSRYSAFDYLTSIIEDTTIYIDELFVYRLFKDVKVFEDSMENNIIYFETKLFGKDQNNDDNLEFF